MLFNITTPTSAYYYYYDYILIITLHIGNPDAIIYHSLFKFGFESTIISGINCGRMSWEISMFSPTATCDTSTL